MALILEHKLNASQANSVQPKSIFLKSYEYVNRVKRLKNKEDVTTARGCVPTLRSRPTPTWHSPRAPLHTPPRHPQSKPNRPAPVADLSARACVPSPLALPLGLTHNPAPRPRDLERCALHEFEIAQLGNLLPDSADEAKALIPSLVEASITNEQLSEVLDQLRSYRSYAS